MKRFPLLVLVVLVTAALTHAQETPRSPQEDIPPISVHRDLEYSKPDGKPQLLDVYVPDDADGQMPVIVWIHGGAWRTGSKNRSPAPRFLGQGYVVVSINYRLSQVARYPAQVHDCKAAIRWLRANSKRFNIDPKRIGVWGSSAGGHLVALLGTSGGAKSLEGLGGNADQSSNVQAVCDFFGPTDFLQMDAHSQPKAPIIHDAATSPESQLIGGPIQQNPKKVAAANPITYVSKDDPPFLIVHGDRDRLVPHHQSQILHDALKKAGVKSTLHIVKGGGHGFRDRRVDELVNEFFARHLKP
ncbi:MAG: esterase [Planctomycetaceae bacterium]|nr:esterase [Planctomycetaceae bacterium]